MVIINLVGRGGERRTAGDGLCFVVIGYLKLGITCYLCTPISSIGI